LGKSSFANLEGILPILNPSANVFTVFPEACLGRECFLVESRDHGLLVLALVVLAFVLGFVFLPSILDSVGVKIPSTWNAATQNVIRLTISTWMATLVASAAQAVLWIRYRLVADIEKLSKELADVRAIQRAVVWLLGILTVLTGYMTLWLGSK
jgi:hypothetical protein